ncbi:MAG: class I tRNA ligase family protein, partial [Patescibacteria group bacterium]
FIHYYEKGLIYRAQRTINWCPRCGTSLSDLEIEYKEEDAKLYYIQYGPFVLATVRPETKFGDTALAVHPDDKRYKKYIGKEIEIETLDVSGSLDVPAKTKSKIIVVADQAVDPKFGTGVIKVTPAHDITDYEISQRHNLPLKQVIDERGRMNENSGKYAGMKVIEAREKIVADLNAEALLLKEEPYRHNIAVCYRCNTPIEPLPSLQWFVKMKNLAEKALNAVKSRKIKIIPENFEKGYFGWLENIRDWTISRQIWWGHQLPVFFCQKKLEEIKNQKLEAKNNEEGFVVATAKPKQCPFCKECEMEQSPDVLDTWFSSALWPFAGLSETDLKKFYPSNILITARDIINLWVGRMIFSGLEFIGSEPFPEALIHGTILTKEGKRMSKSLGTGIDPLVLIEKYGADATRFGIIWQSMGNQDIRWDETAVMAGKKFANKIWNISRFV